MMDKGDAKRFASHVARLASFCQDRPDQRAIDRWARDAFGELRRRADLEDVDATIRDLTAGGGALRWPTVDELVAAVALERERRRDRESTESRQARARLADELHRDRLAEVPADQADQWEWIRQGATPIERVERKALAASKNQRAGAADTAADPLEIVRDVINALDGKDPE